METINLDVINGSPGCGGASFFVGVLILVIYVMPSIIAASKNHPDVVKVVVVNWFLGWTVIGWGLSLGMAMTEPEAAADDG